jgi:putative SOS response-associated peptidase YedK
MCGRFTLITNMNTIAQAFNVAPSLQTPPRYNIAPTQDIVAVMQNGSAHLEWLRWGLIPSWSKEESIGSRMINARAETLAEKPSFKRLLTSRRCLIVADGFYEWKAEAGSKGKTPMYITMKDQQPFAFAGLWDAWKSPEGPILRTCTIVTTEPNELMATIHNRMPAILGPDERSLWLDHDLRDADMLQALLRSYSSDEMVARPVSRLVNSPKNEGAELLAEA